MRKKIHNIGILSAIWSLRKATLTHTQTSAKYEYVYQEKKSSLLLQENEIVKLSLINLFKKFREKKENTRTPTFTFAHYTYYKYTEKLK